MIKILEKKDCCGCGACVQKCPKHCITMKSDEEGFLYPSIDDSTCIDCHLCEKVCPVINQNQSRLPQKTYAAYIEDESIRLKSSSGGMFTHFAEQVIEQGGVVFGACFNDKWEVIHDFTETKEGLEKFRGSKYVQSVIGNSFLEVEHFLKLNRLVLFSGTPCQIAGLNHFLRKHYDNLITIDVVCHGAPSPMVWKSYLDSLHFDKINSVQFRSKEYGWKNFHFSLSSNSSDKEDHIIEPFRQNLFCSGFMHNLYLRPSCYACPSKSGKSGSCITLGDLWGIDNVCKDMDDDKGCSFILDYEGRFIQLKNCIIREIEYDKAIKSNPAVTTSVHLNNHVKKFYALLRKKGFNKAVKKCTTPSRTSILLYNIKHILYLVYSNLLRR